MLYFTRWKALAIIMTALVVCLFAVPNFFPEAKVKTWPLWAQRHIVLGLDLQGGSYLLLELDSNYVKKERLDQVRDEARRVLRDAKIGYTGLAVRGDAVEVRVKESDLQAALPKLRELSQPLGGLLGSSGQRSLEVSDAGGGLIRLVVPQAAITERIRQTNEQSIQIVERRINQLGTVEIAFWCRCRGCRIQRSSSVLWARPPRWNSAWSIRPCRRIRRSRDGCRPIRKC
jgi:preprotein translocase subunit SecD